MSVNQTESRVCFAYFADALRRRFSWRTSRVFHFQSSHQIAW